MKMIKKICCVLCVMLMAVSVMGCEFHVGTSKKKDDYKTIFTDRAEELGSAYVDSFVSYKFSLDGYGEMMIYVDTSEGHKFELQSEDGGFLILDKNGEEVLSGYCMNRSVYDSIMEELSDEKTINGRSFAYGKIVKYYTGLSYMSDCGLDCGLILQSQDENALRLVAFRGID